MIKVCYSYKECESDYMARMNEGKETWHRLLVWDRGQSPAERLAAIILQGEGFQNVDPSHPLGGKDGLKDMVLSYGGKKWIGGVYFPRGQQSLTDIKDKFTHDIAGANTNDATGFVFITNQELRLAERKILSELDADTDVQIYHLERIASILNTPTYYGVRMEFLDIEMTREEQLGFFSTYAQRINRLEDTMQALSIGLENYKVISRANELDDFDDRPRTLDIISEAENEFFEKVWFDRHMSLRYKIENGQETVASDIWKGALASAQKAIDKYGEENLGPYSDFEWGMLNGKLSALRWVLGSEWDMLDT